MFGETGIKVEKPTSVLQKQINVKPKELITSLSKAAINGAFLKWDDLAENGVEILTGLTQLAQGDRKMIVQKYCIKGDIFH
jgi:hypothetical protein